MVFTVLVGVNLNGNCNFKLSFPARPSVAELRARVERDLVLEAKSRRPGVPFVVRGLQVFDERVGVWVDLLAAVQLDDSCQINVLQNECRDLPDYIPTSPTVLGPTEVSDSPQRLVPA
eukprot:Hpha_TRINITY_DN27246_c0_g1::TRINITY_DN27246_c0_g1_i1::g.140681::m.140681